MDEETRGLSDTDARGLLAGSNHYTAYVGPPHQYDFMGATQFRLLCALGLRDRHSVLDFGCGSLRLGRLLIPYLQPGRYYGIEPEMWLVDDAIERQTGRDIIRIKQPSFSTDSSFNAGVFARKFDFIICQSIFSHAGAELIERALASFRDSLEADGLALCTFIHTSPNGPLTEEFAGAGWVYPDCVAYKRSTVVRIIEQSGLAGVELPWYHPRQTWYALGRSVNALPSISKFAHLSGGVLRDPELAAST